MAVLARPHVQCMNLEMAILMVFVNKRHRWVCTAVAVYHDSCLHAVHTRNSAVDSSFKCFRNTCTCLLVTFVIYVMNHKQSQTQHPWPKSLVTNTIEVCVTSGPFLLHSSCEGGPYLACPQLDFPPDSLVRPQPYLCQLIAFPRVTPSECHQQ
jgi:hypothetical protein